MKHDPVLQAGIHACLNALQKILAIAMKETSEACDYISLGEQNMAIGAISTTDALLEQATSLYKAVIALHRCRL